jgi:uncharacterized protein YhhL (DUF1145 family)
VGNPQSETSPAIYKRPNVKFWRTCHIYAMRTFANLLKSVVEMTVIIDYIEISLLNSAYKIQAEITRLERRIQNWISHIFHMLSLNFGIMNAPSSYK